MSVPGDILKVNNFCEKNLCQRLDREIITAVEERVEDLNKVSFEDFQGCDFGMLKYDAQFEV